MLYNHVKIKKNTKPTQYILIKLNMCFTLYFKYTITHALAHLKSSGKAFQILRRRK